MTQFILHIDTNTILLDNQSDNTIHTIVIVPCKYSSEYLCTFDFSKYSLIYIRKLQVIEVCYRMYCTVICPKMLRSTLGSLNLFRRLVVKHCKIQQSYLN